MKSTDPVDAAILGGGAFGTALGFMLGTAGRHIRLWVRRTEHRDEINQGHTNHKYLPDLVLPSSLRATTELREAIDGAPVVLVVVPSRAFREVASALGDHLQPDQLLVHGTKGIEFDSFLRMSEILKQETCALRIGVLSGPNLAQELISGSPSGTLVASSYDEVIQTMHTLFDGLTLQIHGARDIVGTEFAGAFGHIIAIAVGILQGLGFGTNAKALLVAKALSEMIAVGLSQGADVVTFGGLAGVADLFGTCSSPLSRNQSLGARIARGQSLEEAAQAIGSTIEGIPTAAAVHRYALSKGMNLPIVQAVYSIIHERRLAQDVIPALLTSREVVPLRRVSTSLRP